MTRKFKVWLDSGANNQSNYMQEVTLEEIGYTGAEWDVLEDDEREAVMRELAFERSDWGYAEVEDGE